MNFSFFKVDFEKDIDQIDAHVLKISFSMPEIFLESMFKISKLIKFMKDIDRFSLISDSVRKTF